MIKTLSKVKRFAKFSNVVAVPNTLSCRYSFCKLSVQLCKGSWLPDVMQHVSTRGRNHPWCCRVSRVSSAFSSSRSMASSSLTSLSLTSSSLTSWSLTSLSLTSWSLTSWSWISCSWISAIAYVKVLAYDVIHSVNYTHIYIKGINTI